MPPADPSGRPHRYETHFLRRSPTRLALRTDSWRRRDGEASESVGSTQHSLGHRHLDLGRLDSSRPGVVSLRVVLEQSTYLEYDLAPFRVATAGVPDSISSQRRVAAGLGRQETASTSQHLPGPRARSCCVSAMRGRQRRAMAQDARRVEQVASRSTARDWRGGLSARC